MFDSKFAKENISNESSLLLDGFEDVLAGDFELLEVETTADNSWILLNYAHRGHDLRATQSGAGSVMYMGGSSVQRRFFSPCSHSGLTRKQELLSISALAQVCSRLSSTLRWLDLATRLVNEKFGGSALLLVPLSSVRLFVATVVGDDKDHRCKAPNAHTMFYKNSWRAKPLFPTYQVAGIDHNTTTCSLLFASSCSLRSFWLCFRPHYPTNLFILEKSHIWLSRWMPSTRLIRPGISLRMIKFDNNKCAQQRNMDSLQLPKAHSLVQASWLTILYPLSQYPRHLSVQWWV